MLGWCVLSRSAPLWLGSAPSREDSRFGNVRERMPSDILRPSGKLQPRGKLGHIVFSGRNLIFCCSNPIKREVCKVYLGLDWNAASSIPDTGPVGLVAPQDLA